MPLVRCSQCYYNRYIKIIFHLANMLLTINPLFVLSGFVVGLLVGLTGVGGGSLMTPLLMLISGSRLRPQSGLTSSMPR
jgi:uncharacterized membrane protein YfcA